MYTNAYTDRGTVCVSYHGSGGGGGDGGTRAAWCSVSCLSAPAAAPRYASPSARTRMYACTHACTRRQDRKGMRGVGFRQETHVGARGQRRDGRSRCVGSVRADWAALTAAFVPSIDEHLSHCTRPLPTVGRLTCQQRARIAGPARGLVHPAQERQAYTRRVHGRGRSNTRMAAATCAVCCVVTWPPRGRQPVHVCDGPNAARAAAREGVRREA